ncbi:hypothetical protein, partial [Helicobacter sp. MIT 05-5294]|uniref:hypothetical protein n=1 Tax=Helicobacter sp. MIT 05-5294 TaxID=1548150 RepID=UPI00188432EA
ITNTQGQKTIKQTTQKILTPNSYPNYPARLFFKSKQKLSIGILKAYANPYQEKSYDYFLDNEEEIFIADKEEIICVCAYFYKEIEKDKLLSQKKREINKNTNVAITW